MAPFGARLKQERERRNITLDDVAASTKIGTRMLRALEAEQFDQLPGGIFNRGFVRAYARHLGIDEDQAIADYLAVSGDTLAVKKPDDALPRDESAVTESGVTESRTLESEKPLRDIHVPWGLVGVVVILVMAGFAIWSFHARGKSSAQAVVPAATEAPAPESATKPEAPTATAPLTTSQAAAIPVNSGAAATPSSNQPFTVLVKAREESWVRIIADGQEVMSGTLAAATEKSVEGRENIVVKAGNAGALDIFFNGEKISSPGDYDQVKTLTFDVRGLQSVPRSETP